MHRLKKWLWLILLALWLTACGGSSPPAPTVVIPPTTKVADAETRSALSTYDPKTGKLTFSKGTAILQALHTGDVLASEPSGAAPNGLLRKVAAIRTVSGQTVLESTQANLTDAINKGALDAQGSLKPAQVQASRALQPGVALRTNQGIQPQAGNGFDYGVAVHSVFTPDPPGTGSVHIDGVVNFNLGYHVGLDISTCWEIPPVCLDKFEASAGFDQQSDLKITGVLDTPIKKDVDLAEYSFSPITFFIGPVPVVIVPKVKVSVGMDGQAKVQFSYAANERARLQVGARWTDSNGWENISGKDFFYSIGQPQALGSVTLKGGVSMEGQLLLYDIAGPGLATNLGLSFDAQVPRNPVWILGAYISEDITFNVDLPVIGNIASYSAKLLEWNTELARSGNTPPHITILSPQVGVELGHAIDLSASDYSSLYKVSDLEDGRVANIRLTSDRDGPLPTGAYTFSTEGTRVVTITATDSQGASSSAAFTVNVTNTPPTVHLTTSSNLPVYRGVPTQLSGYAQEINPQTGTPDYPVPCDHMAWTSSNPADLLPTRCSGNATFSSNGPRTLTLTATGLHGAKGSASLTLTVADPPANLPPVIDEMHLRDWLGNEIGAGQVVATNHPLSLSVKAHDPENDPLTYHWSACLQGWTALQCSQQGDLPTGADGSASFDPQVHGYGIWTFFITVSDGHQPFATIQSRTITINPEIR